jgi:adenylosuccinate lyase
MLTAVSPIDGRYAAKTKPLQGFFSEFALIKYRVLVEIRYFIALCELPLPQLSSIKGNKKIYADLNTIVEGFTEADAAYVKNIERTTNHDVKAVEYFIKEKFDTIGLSAHKEFVHFALTSQDINNTAVPLMLRDALEKVYSPLFFSILDKIIELSNTWAKVPMLARTHGQPASPTCLGKELLVFAERLENQKKQLDGIAHRAKFGGATGNFNAHLAAYPTYDWPAFADGFVQGLGLERSQFTTQIEHYDNLAAQCHALARINTILIDFARDVWHYISIEYFKQKTIAGEVGSSAMPHKVNPIDFENAEGNLGLANALLEHLAAKLPVSRLQRDLTDSTVLRNLGVPLGHIVVAFDSLMKGMGKLMLNAPKLEADLEANWMVVAEGIQNILRREGYPQPYEALKTLTRGRAEVGRAEIHAFIAGLDIEADVLNELQKLSPKDYTGVCGRSIH